MERLIVTIGPALRNRYDLKQIHKPGRYIYRINGAHGKIEDIEEYVLYIKKQIPDAQIMIDLPGNKIRTKRISDPIPFKTGTTIRLERDNFNYSDYFSLLTPDMTVTTNDGLNHFSIKEIETDFIRVVAKNDGFIYNNKGFYANGVSRGLPFLFEKDFQIIELAKKHRLAFLGLSFVRTVEDVKEAENHIGEHIGIIPKVETRSAMENLDALLDYCRMVLVDRGDLSLEVGIVNVPYYVDKVLEKAGDTRVFIATQFLKFMENNPIPLLSEVNDLYHTIKRGVYGIQLSEETAVGKFPLECLELIEAVMEKAQ